MDVRAQLREFIVDNFMMGEDTAKLSDSGSLLEMGILDSVGVLELVGFLEETFRITVEDDELIPGNLDSVENLINFIRRKAR